MWMDAFLSVALVVVVVLASPIIATFGVPRGLLFGLGLAAMMCGVLLAAFGAITAVVIMLRMRSGQYLLPAQLRLPLPAGMRPAPYQSHPRTDGPGKPDVARPSAPGRRPSGTRRTTHTVGVVGYRSESPGG